MNKQYYEHTLPIIRGSLSNTYEQNRPGITFLTFFLFLPDSGEREIRRSLTGSYRPALLHILHQARVQRLCH